MAAELRGRRVAILATDMFEQVELADPKKALEEAGAEVEIVSIEPGQIQGFNHYDKADLWKVDSETQAATVSTRKWSLKTASSRAENPPIFRRSTRR